MDERKKNMFLVLHDHSSGWDRNPLIDVRRETGDLQNEREDPMGPSMPHYRMSFVVSNLLNPAPEQAEFRNALKSVKASDTLDQVSKKTGRSASNYFTWIPE